MVINKCNIQQWHLRALDTHFLLALLDGDIYLQNRVLRYLSKSKAGIKQK